MSAVQLAKLLPLLTLVMAAFEFPKKLCDQVESRLKASLLHRSLDGEQGTRLVLDVMTSESPHADSNTQPGQEESQVVHAQPSVGFVTSRHAFTVLDIAISFNRPSTTRLRQILT